MDEDETSDPDEDPNELIGDDEDQAVGIMTDPTEAGQPQMIEVRNILNLPDDEEHMDDTDALRATRRSSMARSSARASRSRVSLSMLSSVSASSTS